MTVEQRGFRQGVVEEGVELEGMTVEALDGRVGKVQGVIQEADATFLVVDTGMWILGKTVEVPAGMVSRVDVAEETVFVACDKSQVKDMPEHVPGEVADTSAATTTDAGPESMPPSPGLPPVSEQEVPGATPMSSGASTDAMGDVPSEPAEREEEREEPRFTSFGTGAGAGQVADLPPLHVPPPESEDATADTDALTDTDAAADTEAPADTEARPDMQPALDTSATVDTPATPDTEASADVDTGVAERPTTPAPEATESRSTSTKSSSAKPSTTKPSGRKSSTTKSSGTKSSQRKSGTGTEQKTRKTGTADLPIARYDSLTAAEVIARLPDLTQQELAKVERYERRNGERQTVLSRIESLREDQPWRGYDGQNVDEIKKKLARADDDKARAVRDYERRHRDRAGVMDAARRKLKSD